MRHCASSQWRGREREREGGAQLISRNDLIVFSATAFALSRVGRPPPPPAVGYEAVLLVEDSLSQSHAPRGRGHPHAHVPRGKCPKCISALNSPWLIRARECTHAPPRHVHKKISIPYSWEIGRAGELAFLGIHSVDTKEMLPSLTGFSSPHTRPINLVSMPLPCPPTQHWLALSVARSPARSLEVIRDQ